MVMMTSGMQAALRGATYYICIYRLIRKQKHVLKYFANLTKTPVMQDLDQYISTDRETAGGVPVFKGTRVAVQTLFDHLEDSSLDDFLEGFPSVSRAQAKAVIELAATKILSEAAA
jgi:uncharacterized protein (DUF433 family)